MKREVTTIHSYCDYCEADLGPNGTYIREPVCHECGKDVCEDHSVALFYRPPSTWFTICRTHLNLEKIIKQ